MQEAALNTRSVIHPVFFDSAPYQVVVCEGKSRVGVAGNWKCVSLETDTSNLSLMPFSTFDVVLPFQMCGMYAVHLGTS
jgi:hypothetical protein